MGVLKRPRSRAIHAVHERNAIHGLIFNHLQTSLNESGLTQGRSHRLFHEVDPMLLPETILLDLRYGIRALSRSPWSTAITILSLAVGIGVNTAVFTAYKAFVARPLDA